MPPPLFQILDHVETPIGVLYLRRRELLGRPGTVVTEVSVEHELLMSSLNTESERALATLALRLHSAPESRDDLEVLVGGLGLGYTARAALADPRVGRVEVVERVPAVIDWMVRGLLPLSNALNADDRLALLEGDVYAQLLGPPQRTYDLVLIDVDHSPREPLDLASAPFYTAEGLRAARAHLRPGGVLAVWSAEPDDAFLAVLQQVFPGARAEVVTWINELIDDGQEVEDVVFLGRREPE